jgi:hypothetical protein
MLCLVNDLGAAVGANGNGLAIRLATDWSIIGLIQLIWSQQICAAASPFELEEQEPGEPEPATARRIASNRLKQPPCCASGQGAYCMTAPRIPARNNWPNRPPGPPA